MIKLLLFGTGSSSPGPFHAPAVPLPPRLSAVRLAQSAVWLLPIDLGLCTLRVAGARANICSFGLGSFRSRLYSARLLLVDPIAHTTGLGSLDLGPCADRALSLIEESCASGFRLVGTGSFDLGLLVTSTVTYTVRACLVHLGLFALGLSGVTWQQGHVPGKLGGTFTPGAFQGFGGMSRGNAKNRSSRVEKSNAKDVVHDCSSCSV